MKPFYSILLILILLLAAEGHCQTSQFDKQDDTSIYSFLKKNELTNKTEQEFYFTYADRAKAKELYSFFVENKLTTKDFDTFYNDNFSNTEISKAPITYKDFSARIKKKYPEYKDVDDLTLAKKMVEKYPYYKDKVSFKEQQNSTVNTNTSNSHFQIDKIKVGDAHIELPIPSGFVKVDDSIEILFEFVKKMCPKINTLLACYISEEDYANFLATQNCTFDKFLLVEASNDLKDKQINSKDYRKLINSFKKEYIEEFKQILDKAGHDASENISNLNEKLKMDNIKMQPFGICFESKNSLSYGILSKFTFTIENESSTDNIVAAIATITRIDKKPIYLFSYKKYDNNLDISSLKEMNLAWIKEVDRKQSPVSFIADIDFEDYKEAILAILTLSFIWAIYFATKKIHKKIKEKAVSEELEVVEKNNLFDFDELLKEVGTTPNDLAYNEEISAETLQEKEEIISEPTTVRNPELLKVGRRMRLLHFLIDMLFLYFIAYCSGYILVFIFGPSKALKIVEHTYLYGGSLAFIVYFSQEFIFGKTLGKLFTGTRVVDSLGNKPDIVKLIIRNASRLIPLEAFSFLGSNKRGWHDTISDTFVIKD